MREAVSDRAWLQAMLDAEAALAKAEARGGVIPHAAAAAIAAACDSKAFDIDELARGAVAVANPAGPLVEALTKALPPEAATYVHWGATSQDIVDSAMMLVVRNGLGILIDDGGVLEEAAAKLAREHRGTLMAGRTLLQQAVPITFGLKAAGWLTAIVDARASLIDVRDRRLAAQLGGAAGTLSALGSRGLQVAGYFAEELGLAAPVMPWHTARGRVAEVAGALAIAAGVAGKIALDVQLLAQTEVGEASESGTPGRGRSSTMPHKRNPVTSVAVIAAVRRAQALAPVLLGAMLQEHERAGGAWQAEWPALSDLLLLTGTALAGARTLLADLEVYPERMTVNLNAGGEGLIMAESVYMALAARCGRVRARAITDAACAKALTSPAPLREVLLADRAVLAHLTPDEVERALDPRQYLGATDELIDRALAHWKQSSGQG